MLITIFTPIYNRANKLYRAYESLKQQTIKKIDEQYIFEWIIVDDGSTDNTKELVEKWQKESDFEIRYFYQSNKGKIHALRKGIDLSKCEWFLQLDSDDACKKETIEVFYNTINQFSNDELERCGGIGVLHQDQYGKPIGNDYPIEKKLLYTLDIIFKWRYLGLGDTWALLKTQNLKKSFIIPEEAKHLKFIPETFFWDRITFELKPYSYFINKRLGIVYRNEDDNISHNIRQKYPEGFLFESKWFINNYPNIFFKSPNAYIKHLLKYIIYSRHLNFNISDSLNILDNLLVKILFVSIYPIGILLSRYYLKVNK